MFNYNVLGYVVAVLPISVYCAYLLFKKSEKKSIDEVYWTNHLSTKCESSDCNLNYCTLYRNKQLTKYIENSKYSIDLAMHIFTSIELSDAILQAFKRNVRVRILCCNLQQSSTGSQVWKLFDEGVEVRFQKVCGDQLMHHKFCVIDGQNRVSYLMKKFPNQKHLLRKSNINPILITGSCNWTRQGLYANWENIIVTSNEKYVDTFEKEFELIWKTFRPQRPNE